MINAVTTISLVLAGFSKKQIQQLAYDANNFFAIEDCELLQRSSLQDIEALKHKAGYIIEQASKKHISILTPFDDFFPKQLHSIANPPILLTAKGNLDALNKPNIAVVGSRNASLRGKQAARKIGQILAEQNYIVASGLALGCDTNAHLGCLDRNGITTAVLAHGLDNPIYPATNQALAENIVINGGCLISEYLPKIKATKIQFIERNRIQSGLSKGTILVESKLTGGTMHTAKFCRAQQRSLACVHYEGVPNDFEQYRGNSVLLEDKDTFAIKSAADVIKYLSTTLCKSL